MYSCGHPTDNKESLQVLKKLFVSACGECASTLCRLRMLKNQFPVKRSYKFCKREWIDEYIPHPAHRNISDFSKCELKKRTGGNYMQRLAFFIKIP